MVLTLHVGLVNIITLPHSHVANVPFVGNLDTLQPRVMLSKLPRLHFLPLTAGRVLSVVVLTMCALNALN